MMRTWLLLIALTLYNIADAQPVFRQYILNKKSSPSRPVDFIDYKDKLIFSALDTDGRFKTYITDSSTLGTGLLLNMPHRWSVYTEYTIANNMLFFGALDTMNGGELWVSDGTAGHTTYLSIFSGKYSSNPAYIRAIDSIVVFQARDATHDKELWISDGTTNGTRLLKDIYPGPQSGIGDISLWGQAVTVYKKKVYFAANDPDYGRELWVTDGTDTGTHMFIDMCPGKDSSSPLYMKVVGDRLYFTASNGNNGRQLWVTDGTIIGTNLVALSPVSYDNMDGGGAVISNHNEELGIAMYNGQLYFNYDNGFTGPELYVTDTTWAGAHIVKDITPGKVGSNPTKLCVYNGMLYFATGMWGSAVNKGIWVTDGTDTGTHCIKSINVDKGRPTDNMTVYNNLLYFTTFDSATGYNLFCTNGTDTGTKLVLNKRANQIDPLIYAYDLHEYKGALFFCGDYITSNGIQLWSVRDTVYSLSAKPVPGIVSGFCIYPNPNNGNFTIKLSNDNMPVNAVLTVYDITGKLLHQQMVTAALTQVQLQGLSKGMHLIKLQQGDAVSTARVMVE